MDLQEMGYEGEDCFLIGSGYVPSTGSCENSNGL
jgi:hypothetical protein